MIQGEAEELHTSQYGLGCLNRLAHVFNVNADDLAHQFEDHVRLEQTALSRKLKLLQHQPGSSHSEKQPGTPKGSYSPRGRSRHLLETPFSENLLRTLLRTLFNCKTHRTPPSQSPSENPSPEPSPEPSQNPS